MEDLTGKQLGQYRIIAPLGEGGMAAVYKAYQPSMDRYVALKILSRHYATDPKFIGRFEREAKVIASLEHPNILPVHDYGEADGYAYIVMRYVEGETLARLLQGQSLPLPKICHIISQLADALDYAHSRGIVHRDMKPSNVLIDKRGNCLLADFGIAKILGSSMQFTATGAFVGTPVYASPEQGLGIDLEASSDIYSLGVMLYEMATGRPPFEAETPMAILMKHIHDPLPSPRTINPTLPEVVERVILRALAKQPEDRFQTAGEMARALAAAAAAPVPEPQPAATTRPYPERGRGILTWGWILGGLVALAVLVGLLGGSVVLFAIATRATATPTAASAAGPATAVATPTLTVPAVTPTLTTEFELPGFPPTSEALESGPHPALVVGSDHQIHLTWADNSSGTWDVYYARSADGGANFSQPVTVDSEATGAARGHPTLAVGPDGSVYVAWEDTRGGDWDIYCARSDDGQAFSPPVLADDDATGKDQAQPTIVVGRDGTVYLAWQDSRGGDWDIYYARSADGGASFSENVRVNDETRSQQVDPTIGVDSQGRVHVIWTDDQSGARTIYYAGSEGEGFLRGRIVGSGLMSDLSSELSSLTVGLDDDVHVGWANAYIRHPTYGSLLYLPVYSVSADGGETFSDPRQVGEGYSYVSVRPPETGLAADDGVVHVVLTTYSPRDGSWVWYYRSDDGGQGFGAGVGVKQVEGGDVLHYPVVAVGEDGRIHAAWAHQRGAEWDVYYAQSSDGGGTFSERAKVSGGR